MELAAVKALLDAGKAVENAVRGGRLIERMSNEGMDAYTLLSVKNMLDGAGIKAEACDLDDSGWLEQADGTENLEGEDAFEDEAAANQEWAGRTQEEREEYLAGRREQFLREERNPSRMPADTARRLSEKSNLYNASRWEQLDAAGRMEMLQEMFRDMAEEAYLPGELAENTEIGRDSLEYGFEDAVEALYRETVWVMQQQCLAGPGNAFTYGMEHLKEPGNTFTYGMEYLKEPMEAYAHQQASIFIKMYRAMRTDNL